MIKLTAEKLATLPKWAQSYIRGLETEVSSYEDYANKEYSEKDEIYYHDRMTGKKYRIPATSVVYFRIGSNEVYFHKNELSLEVFSSPRYVHILPMAANHFMVKFGN